MEDSIYTDRLGETALKFCRIVIDVGRRGSSWRSQLSPAAQNQITHRRGRRALFYIPCHKVGMFMTLCGTQDTISLQKQYTNFFTVYTYTIINLSRFIMTWQSAQPSPLSESGLGTWAVIFGGPGPQRGLHLDNWLRLVCHIFFTFSNVVFMLVHLWQVSNGDRGSCSSWSESLKLETSLEETWHPSCISL